MKAKQARKLSEAAVLKRPDAQWWLEWIYRRIVEAAERGEWSIKPFDVTPEAMQRHVVSILDDAEQNYVCRILMIDGYKVTRDTETTVYW